MNENRIEEHSCLLETQHGAEEEMKPLSDDEAAEVLAQEEIETDISIGTAAVRGGVSLPTIARVYQAKAATRHNRSNSQIDQIVIHTPEGYEGGTLSVLQNGRAGFDWYLPPSGRLYKCNAFAKYVAWQAGYWPSNLRSIGVEQWDFADNMGKAPDEHYRRLAALVAWLTQLLDIPVRHAGWNEAGLVAHAQITPKSRTDPGRNFDWDKLIRYTNEARGKGGSAPSDTVFRVLAGAFTDRAGAERRAAELQSAGFGKPWIYEHNQYHRVQVSSWSDQRDADRVVEALKAKGFSAYALAESSGKDPAR